MTFRLKLVFNIARRWLIHDLKRIAKEKPHPDFIDRLYGILTVIAARGDKSMVDKAMCLVEDYLLIKLKEAGLMKDLENFRIH